MKAVVIGASTGGPKALETLLSKLPGDFDGVVVVMQHLPLNFTVSMVERFESIVNMPIHHIQMGDVLKPRNIYVVPGNKHFFIVTPGLRVFLLDAAEIIQPSVDMGFTSVAEHYGPDTIGVVLTGMGNDGVLGSKAIKQVGGTVIVQDEDTSIIYGMPFAVKLAGFADEVLPLDKIPERLVELVNGK
ncbi:chemotaxis protein CheB [Patescibacteria group bacterium]|nr:chemotaxis protein CheB [Patescibacteria group bacterium]